MSGKEAQVKAEKPVKEDPARDEQDDDSDDEEHHHEGHDHEHPHDHPHGEGDKEKKQSRGEKKVKKAMLKMGLKEVKGITKVTIRKQKAVSIYIENPDVLKSPGSENAYIIFGEAKLQDPNSLLAGQEARNLAKPEKPDVEQVTIQPEKAADNAEEVVDESNLKEEDIKTVMDQVGCSRGDAVKALRKAGGDAVTAIMEMQG
eukprot:TRINITY_DN0_c324_g1_i4.p1 TRINITY_DN0_c324_g1~~TRINITY_DN0_c324_g1_i4.p1  ORF type:complete len:202 (+),score=81.93 TRINITY_DN0_c324_g1_i4:44-649(+)